jgi:hypothetical protein
MFTYGHEVFVDHQIAAIEVMPQRGNGKRFFRFGFNDKNADDDYSYRVWFWATADSRVVLQRRHGNLCSRGECTVGIAKPPGDVVFVLSGFELKFRDGDRHLDEIGILENDGKVTVYFNDKSDDDAFEWSIEYAYIPRDMFAHVGSTEGRKAKGYAEGTKPVGDSVIRGFKLKFKNYFTSGDDHQIRVVGVSLANAAVFVYYADKNGDDGFDWEVRWGVLR